MDQERTAIILHDALPMDRALELARKADAKGFWGVFMIEEAGYDTQMTLGAMALVTRQARLGSSISSIYTRTAPIYAMAANTLDALSGGRAMLGLGTSPPYFVKHWHSTEFERPVSRIKDYVRIVREILSGEKLAYEGRAVHCRDFQLAVEAPRQPIPLYVGAIGPQMIAAAGEVADGVLLSPLVSEEYLAYAVEHVQRGAAKAGRDWRAVDIAAPVITTVDTDPQRALETARSMVAYFAVVYYYDPLFTVSGYKALGEEIRRTNKEKGWLAAREVVTDELVRKFSIVGTPDDCRRRIGELRAAGLTLPVLNAPGPRRIFGQPLRVPVHAWGHSEAIVEYLP
ncbi:MAG TPA: LLM class flavin-dependent oxidoreductase [Chloroflexota bacterium]|nr:LLM class flavin-dependent oxidoreductase [Chloroflexota bacterium]